MKKLFISLLALSSISVFASEDQCLKVAEDLGPVLASCHETTESGSLGGSMLHLVQGKKESISLVYCDPLHQTPNVVEILKIWHDVRGDDEDTMRYVSYQGSDSSKRRWQVAYDFKEEVRLAAWSGKGSNSVDLVDTNFKCPRFTAP